jgi:hypothetical protein|nr:MAG TPA: hypothetical protein [Caudoviricetes sp.]
MNDENIGVLNALLQIEKQIQIQLKDVVSNTISSTSQSPLNKKLVSLLNINEQYLKQLEDVYNRSSE